MTRRMQIAVDCSDPERLAEFWADILGYRVADAPDHHETWAAFSVAEASEPGERRFSRLQAGQSIERIEPGERTILCRGAFKLSHWANKVSQRAIKPSHLLVNLPFR